ADRMRAVFSLRRHLHRCTWIALVAMWALALAPTLSHALSFARGQQATLAEICTPQGTRFVDADGQSVPASGPGNRGVMAAHLDPCPFCAVHAGAVGLPNALDAAPLRADLSQAQPALYLHAPHTLHAWRTAQSRAPPASC